MCNISLTENKNLFAKKIYSCLKFLVASIHESQHLVLCTAFSPECPDIDVSAPDGAAVAVVAVVGVVVGQLEHVRPSHVASRVTAATAKPAATAEELSDATANVLVGVAVKRIARRAKFQNQIEF